MSCQTCNKSDKCGGDVGGRSSESHGVGVRGKTMDILFCCVNEPQFVYCAKGLGDQYFPLQTDSDMSALPVGDFSTARLLSLGALVLFCK